jgi:hypothetical protein
MHSDISPNCTVPGRQQSLFRELLDEIEFCNQTLSKSFGLDRISHGIFLVGGVYSGGYGAEL